ncbi:MiaB/RimO family radical SAM methylthiotransferase [Candidatus Gracilibacteria bacterium]|nr:MiaB/RimO family radical SAM methylthiotransferase [Candidatus Gracilibacteria bacterium]
MNYSDSARIKAILINCGMKYTSDIKQADIVIFDTCSVRQKSEDKITGKLKEIGKNQKVWITGCMIQHNLRNAKIDKMAKFKVGNFSGSLKSKTPEIIGLTTDEINDFKNKYPPEKGDKGGLINNKGNIVGINNAFNPMFFNLSQKLKNIELFFRIDDVGFLPIILPKIGYKIKYNSEIINEYEKIIPQGINTSMNPHQTTAYIPISTGCNQFCAYCIVPYARGLERNFPLKQIVDEAKLHIQNGAQEIVLLGQIVNKHPDFIEILKSILKIEGLKRLRYTSPYPTYYSKELLELHEKENKLCPHIHIPLQSGSDNILKKMFRGYDSKQCYEFIDKIRGLKRHISITTDIIVGFPGETEKDFKETIKLIKYGKFDMIYIGIYSSRPGTLAAKKYENDIPYKTKHKRRSKLNELLKKNSLENNKKEIGSIKEVLVNEILIQGNTKTLKHGNIIGYTDNMKQTLINIQDSSKIKEGDFLTVKIIDGKSFKLYGEIINKNTTKH